ncbi:MAG: PQQ-binding-like beta-propeller repeat protein [Thalassovita sp.]
MKTSVLFLGIAGLAVLAGCAEKEEILLGKRESIYSVLSSGTPPASAVAENQSVSIRLPAQKANADWTHGVGSPAYRTKHPALGAAPTLVWSAPIGAGDSKRNRIVADPVVAGGRVFTLDAQATVAATSTEGAPVWSADLTPPRDSAEEATGGGLAFGDGKLFVTSGFGTLTALDPANGTVLWQQNLLASGSGAPTYYKGLVYVTSGDDTGWAIEADSGRVRWQLTALPNTGNVLGAPAPAVNNKFVIYGYGDGEVQAAFRKGGMRHWVSQLAGSQRDRALTRLNDITGEPVIDGKTVYVGSNAGRMVALDLDTGERKWTAREGAIGAMWPVGGSVFAINLENQLMRLSARDGSRVWAVQLPNYVKFTQRKASEIYANYGPVVAGGRVIVASNDGQMRFFDPKDGNQVYAVEVPDGATTSAVVAGRTLYVVSSKGELHAFR